MRIFIAAVLCLTPSLAHAGQTAERKGGSIIMYDYPYDARLDSCTIGGAEADATMSGQLSVRPRSGQRVGPAPGFDVDIVPSASGAPAVSTHAIDASGTGAGARDRGAARACAVGITTVGQRGGMVASCAIGDTPEGMTVSFSIPLSTFGPLDSAKTGHVTLIKRGDAVPGASVVAQCTSGSPKRASWDLATLKK